jgi:protein-S-isoprenylcysteine O-methyltransferase Ste14
MGSRWFALIRAFIIGAIFVSLWTWFVPRWMGSSMVPQWNLGPIFLMALGAAVMIRCVWDFAWTGRGTPAPFDPPRRLVITGLYRYVRNPMYVGMGLFLIGEALVLPDIGYKMLALVLILWIVVTLFIIFYEEPTLQSLFRDDYAEYRRNVRRWIPRLTPFDKSRSAAVPSPHLD